MASVASSFARRTSTLSGSNTPGSAPPSSQRPFSGAGGTSPTLASSPKNGPTDRSTSPVNLSSGGRRKSYVSFSPASFTSNGPEKRTGRNEEAPAELPEDWTHGTTLWVADVVITLTEFADFVAGLATLHLGLRRVVIAASYHGLQGRRLEYGGNDNRAPLREKRIASLDRWDCERIVDVAGVLADPERFGRTLIREFFARFYCKPDEALVLELEEKFRR